MFFKKQSFCHDQPFMLENISVTIHKNAFAQKRIGTWAFWHSLMNWNVILYWEQEPYEFFPQIYVNRSDKKKSPFSHIDVNLK